MARKQMSVVLGPEFAWVHDSELIAVMMNRHASTLELGYRAESGSNHTVQFTDVGEYRIDDLFHPPSA